MKTKPSNPKPKFKLKKPPVVELVLACFFPEIADFRSEHVGIFWDKIRVEFPNSQQVSPIVELGQIQATDKEFLPMPRFWFSSEDQTQLVQIQKNAFMLNWRSQPEQAYPHFDALAAQFDRIFEKFQTFLGNDLRTAIKAVDRLELTYINVIQKNAMWSSVNDLPMIFPCIKTPEIGNLGSSLENLALSYNYKSSDAVHIALNIKSGKLPTGDEPAIVLEIKAFGTPTTKRVSEVPDWFASAHEATGYIFKTITNPTMRRDVWGETT